MSDAVLAAVGLSRSFGRSWAVRRVSVELSAGTLTALTGDNGAGKSTLLALLAGLLRPSEGEVMVFGEAFNGFFPTDIRERLGFLGHLPFVYPDLSGRENLAFFRGLYGVDASRAPTDDALLAEVGLSDAAHRLARTYSRGMTQRLALARMLLQDAPIWLLDEPSTGLDAAGQALLARVLAEARARGRCVVAVTHDLAPLGQIDREVRLRGGRLA